MDKVKVSEYTGQSGEKCRSEDAGHDVDKHIGQGFDDTLERVHLLVRLGL